MIPAKEETAATADSSDLSSSLVDTLLPRFSSSTYTRQHFLKCTECSFHTPSPTLIWILIWKCAVLHVYKMYLQTHCANGAISFSQKHPATNLATLSCDVICRVLERCSKPEILCCRCVLCTLSARTASPPGDWCTFLLNKTIFVIWFPFTVCSCLIQSVPCLCESMRSPVYGLHTLENVDNCEGSLKDCVGCRTCVCCDQCMYCISLGLWKWWSINGCDPAISRH